VTDLAAGFAAAFLATGFSTFLVTTFLQVHFLAVIFILACSFTFVPAMYLISSERAYSISLFFVKSMFFI
jgi:hypothetical protein